jgi:cell division protein FtsX
MFSQLRVTDRSMFKVLLFVRLTIINYFSMPNLFSFVINMLNQIYNDCKKTEHICIQLKYNVSNEEKKRRVRERTVQ